MSVTGFADRDPVRVGASVSDMMAGMYAANGVQAALLARAKSGEGRHVDVSMLDASVSVMGLPMAQLHQQDEVCIGRGR